MDDDELLVINNMAEEKKLYSSIISSSRNYSGRSPPAAIPSLIPLVRLDEDSMARIKGRKTAAAALSC